MSDVEREPRKPGTRCENGKWCSPMPRASIKLETMPHAERCDRKVIGTRLSRASLAQAMQPNTRLP